MSFASLMKLGKVQSAQSHASLQEKIKDEQQRKLEEQQRRSEEQARQLEKRAALQKLEAEREAIAREKDALRLKELADRRAARLEQAESEQQPLRKKRKLSESPPPRSRSVSNVRKQSHHRASSPSVTDPRLSHTVDRATLNAAMSHNQLQKKASFDPYAIVELTPSENKRDLRTIDEIERELHKEAWEKRGLPVNGDAFFHKSSDTVKKEAVNAKMEPTPIIRTGEAISKSQSAAQVLPTKRSWLTPRPSPPGEKKPAKHKSSWDIPKKIVAEKPRPRSALQKVEREGPCRSTKAEEPTGDYRDEIWKMFGKKRSAYTADDGDSGDSDMERGTEDLLREEEEAARLARREDQREERLLAQKKREKEERKVARH